MFDFIKFAHLVPLFPLLAFVLIVFFTNRDKQLSSSIAILGIGLSWLLSWAIDWQVVTSGPNVNAFSMNWAPTGDTFFKIGAGVDGLTAAMLFMVPFVCMLIFIYARAYMIPPDLHVDPRYSASSPISPCSRQAC